MTPPQKTEPSPTLVEDLEAVAVDEDEAANHPYCDPGPHRKYALRAARLRAAAARLAKELRLAAMLVRDTGGEPQAVYLLDALQRINASPPTTKIEEP